MIRNMCTLQTFVAIWLSSGSSEENGCNYSFPFIWNMCYYCRDGFYLSEANKTCVPCDFCTEPESVPVNCSWKQNTICRGVSSSPGFETDVSPNNSIFSVLLIITGIIMMASLVVNLIIFIKRLKRRSAYKNNHQRDSDLSVMEENLRSNFNQLTIPQSTLIEVDQNSITERYGNDFDKTFHKDLSPKNENITAYLHKDQETQTLVYQHQRKNIMNRDWDCHQTITNTGGTLQNIGSDVKLTIPPQSLLTSSHVEAFGAVYTNLSDIHDKFDIKDDQFVISPVVEFSLGDNAHLNKFAIVEIPHCASGDLSSIRVQWFSSTGSPNEKVPLYDMKNKINIKANNELLYPFYEVTGSIIKIYTKHFSGFICTECKNSVTMTLYVTVFGAYRYIETRTGEWNLDVRAYIDDQRSHLNDFQTALKETEKRQGRGYIEHRVFCRRPRNDFSINIEFILRDEDEASYWEYQNVCSPSYDLPLESILTCPEHIPAHTVDWILSAREMSTPKEVQCLIDVKCREMAGEARAITNVSADNTKILFNLKKVERRCEPRKFGKDTENNIEEICNTLEEKLSLGQCMTFCRRMGVSPDEIDEKVKKLSAVHSDHEIVGRLIYLCKKRYSMNTSAFFDKMTKALAYMEEKGILPGLSEDIQQLIEPENANDILSGDFDNITKPIQATDIGTFGPTGLNSNFDVLKNAGRSDNNIIQNIKNIDGDNSLDHYGIPCQSTLASYHRLHLPVSNPLNLKYSPEAEAFIERFENTNDVPNGTSVKVDLEITNQKQINSSIELNVPGKKEDTNEQTDVKIIDNNDDDDDDDYDGDDDETERVCTKL